MSEIKTKIHKIENNCDHKRKSNVTRYDLREFALELDAIQRRNKSAKKAENRFKTSENTLSMRQTKKKVKEIMSEDIVDERLEKLEPKPSLKGLFIELDDKFFDGFLHRNRVNPIWNKSSKTNAVITRIGKQEQSSYNISLPRSSIKKMSRRYLTETLLFVMIQNYLMLTKKEYSLTDKSDRKLLVTKIKEINDLAKTNINENQIAIDVNLEKNGSSQKTVSSLPQTQQLSQPNPLHLLGAEIKEEKDSDEMKKV